MLSSHLLLSPACDPFPSGFTLQLLSHSYCVPCPSASAPQWMLYLPATVPHCASLCCSTISPNLLADQLHASYRSWRLFLLLIPSTSVPRRCQGAVYPPETPTVSRLVKESPACGFFSNAHESISHSSLILPILTPILKLSPHLRSEILNFAR